MEETWRSRSEEGVDAERPARSGEDEEKSLPGRVAAGDFLSHTQEGVKKPSWMYACLSWLRSMNVCVCVCVCVRERALASCL